MLGLFTWHVWHAPRWLLAFTWNMERVATQYFSVGVMMRTLFAHWHKDIASYKQGTVSGIALAFVWNLISRGVGFCVRVAVLLLYSVAAFGIAALGLVGIITFLVWPLLIIIGITVGIGLLV